MLITWVDGVLNKAYSVTCNYYYARQLLEMSWLQVIKDKRKVLANMYRRLTLLVTVMIQIYSLVTLIILIDTY